MFVKRMRPFRQVVITGGMDNEVEQWFDGNLCVTLGLGLCEAGAGVCLQLPGDGCDANCQLEP